MNPAIAAQIEREQYRGSRVVRYVGGPAHDHKGRMKNFPKYADVTQQREGEPDLVHRYKLKHTRTGPEYHFVRTAEADKES